MDCGACRGAAACGGTARQSRRRMRGGGAGGGGPGAHQTVRGNPRRDLDGARGLLRRGTATRRGDRGGRGQRRTGARGAAARPRGARPRAARAGDAPQRRRGPDRGRDRDYPKHRLSVGERAVKRVSLLLGALAVVPLPPRAPPAPDAPALTIARLPYDGGGHWYTGPAKLPSLL